MDSEGGKNNEQHQDKCEGTHKSFDDVVELASSSESCGSHILSQLTSEHSNFSDELTNKLQEDKQTRGTVNIIDEKLVAVLDRYKITDRSAVSLIATIASALNVDVQSLILNRSSIRRIRRQLREAKAKMIKTVFQTVELCGSVLHWDGKRLKNSTGENVEKLPIVLSSGKIEKILGIPELGDGTGKSQASAIFEVISEWGLCDNIQATCCDTTASNLGHTNGAAVLLEGLLEKQLLYLPCRHHIFELILRAVFETKIPSTSGPEVPLFKRFQHEWSNIDKKQYKTGVEDSYVKEKLLNRVDDINLFLQNQLDTVHPRDDYKELLLLVQIFLGKNLDENVSFKKPGAFHHARWMAKAIYALKIFLFREQFQMTVKLKIALADICIFITVVYVQAWFTCPVASEAPNNDLKFINSLFDYKLIDEKISQTAIKKFGNHLWYLSTEAVAMAFFDEKLSISLRKRMVLMLNCIDNDTVVKKRACVTKLESLSNLAVDSFVSSKSRQFFDRFGINQDFLELDPSQWCSNESYKKGLMIVNNLRVVNDTAERAVKLMQEYNNVLTKNSDQQQFTVQLVSEYQKLYADTRKCAIIDSLMTKRDSIINS